MKTIKCYCGKDILIDDDKHEELSQYVWSCANKSVSHNIGTNRTRARLPIAKYVIGFSCEIVDHIDRDIHNNQRTNLRAATRQQNCCNVGLRKDNTTGLKGVFYTGRRLPWRVGISKNGKMHWIGQYATKEEAAIAYNTKAKEFHGEFAFLNPL